MKNPHSFILILFLAVLLHFPAMAFGDEMAGQTNAPSGEEKSVFNPGLWLISFYRNTISTVDSDRCPSIPSCSSYAAQAFKKHGFFVGWMMTVDRLIHEGKGETTVSPMVFSGGKWKIYDPLENNDFWWYSCKFSINPGCKRKIPLNPPLQ